jgi:glutathione synthase/RimK-type ligase-like ATP-grasp enzyme
MSDKKKGPKSAAGTPGATPATPAPRERRKTPRAPKAGAAPAAVPEVPRDAGDGEPPHGDPLRPAVAAGEAFTGADREATRHGEHPPHAGTIDSAAPAAAASQSGGQEAGGSQGAEPVATGGAPDPMMPDVWAPAQPDGPPGQAPVEAGTNAVSGDGARTDDGARGVAESTYSESALTEGAPAVSRNTRTARVGLFVGREWSFPPAFIQAVERRDAGVQVELAKIGAPHFDEPGAYDLCIDRISHEVPVYRSYLKHAALTGTTVVNNPFMWTADDKFFGASLAHRLGVASPKTVVLPNREYVPGIVPSESLRNMEYPLDWQGIADYVGMPCVLKDAHGGGWKEVYICHSLQELVHHYNHSGLLTMIVQEFIEFEHFVRCLVIGRQEVLPMKYDPKGRRYVVDHAHLTPELGARIVGDARTLCGALGYDMNSMEFAIRDGVPYAIDFMNPAPDMDVNSLTPLYFEWAVETMADMAVRLATEARDGGRATREPSWGTLFGGAAMGRSGS